MKRQIILYLLFLPFFSCVTSKNEYKVAYKGALKDIMHKGDISAKINLSFFEEKNHIYALGAIENLKGEIQIFNSKPFNTIVIDNTLTFDNSFKNKATLLVYASVEKWNKIIIPENISTYTKFEEYIENTARINHINTDEPFPFLIEGTAQSFNWHVIDWKDDDMHHTHEKHKTSGLYGTINNSQVEMLGFYSNAHHTIFTHHTTNMHIHVKTADGEVAGHVDDMILGKEMILKLPAIN